MIAAPQIITDMRVRQQIEGMMRNVQDCREDVVYAEKWWVAVQCTSMLWGAAVQRRCTARRRVWNSGRLGGWGGAASSAALMLLWAAVPAVLHACVLQGEEGDDLLCADVVKPGLAWQGVGTASLPAVTHE